MSKIMRESCENRTANPIQTLSLIKWLDVIYELMLEDASWQQQRMGKHKIYIKHSIPFLSLQRTLDSIERFHKSPFFFVFFFERCHPLRSRMEEKWNANKLSLCQAKRQGGQTRIGRPRSDHKSSTIHQKVFSCRWNLPQLLIQTAHKS